jgi:putative thioredoxin
VATLGLSESERQAIERFEKDVIQPSMTSLVVLQFTAEWCGPCKQLSPILDKLAADYAAKGVTLIRIDVDQDKVIAAQFRIQSIPTVYALYQGQPVADLTSYRTEGQLARAIDQLIRQLNVVGQEAEREAEIEPLIAMAEQVLADGDAPRAANIFSQIRELAPENEDAAGGLIRALVAGGDLDEARASLAELGADLQSKPAVVRAKAALELAGSAGGADHSDLEARIAAHPEDLEARFELAGAKAASGDRNGAADALLDIIHRDRDWNEGAARQRFLQLLEAQGLADPWSREQRRRLSALLFT